MPRANRHHIPGQVWHITHRCHKGEFLFKFLKDRKAWIGWLFEAKKRYGLIVLDYIVTSNHIHLLVVDEDSNAISKSIQLIAGRTAREFNRRKGRRGAYWEDRYHATAIASGEHLMRCLIYPELFMNAAAPSLAPLLATNFSSIFRKQWLRTLSEKSVAIKASAQSSRRFMNSSGYIDMNMVRVGVVGHPSEWIHGGCPEIESPPLRYRLIDRERLIEACGLQNNQQVSLQLCEF